MKFKGLKIGDKVYVREHRGTRKAEVTGVGRKYFNVGNYVFRLEDGSSKSGYSPPFAITVDAHDHMELVSTARSRLASCGIEFHYGVRDDKVLLVHDTLLAAGVLP